MADMNFLFLPVGQYCIRDVLTCSPDDRIVDAARRMRERNISSLVICEMGIPTGIVTDSDLRNKLVAQEMDPHDVRVRSVMNAPLITVSQEEHLLDALLRMSRHHIHRLIVLDQSGRLAGIISNSDINRIQEQSPHLLVREIEEAVTIDELRILHLRVQDLVGHLLETGVAIQQLIRLIAHLNDQVLLRLIQIIRAARYADMSDCFTLVVLGSQGRGEQTLTTDQDTAMIYADDLPADEVQRLAEFCCEVIDAFVAIGIPCCPGDTMASNEFWRRSSAEWHLEVDRWFSSITLENIINVAMFCDMRTLYGDPALERGVKQHIETHIGRNDLFLMKMAANIHRIPIPLSWTGRIKREMEGERQGQLDINLGGIFTITEGI
jgi:CBS domain-containing protein